MIGDMLNNSDKGGSSGGGGATGDWKENDQPQAQPDYNPPNLDLNQNDSTITDSSHVDDPFS